MFGKCCRGPGEIPYKNGLLPEPGGQGGFMAGGVGGLPWQGWCPKAGRLGTRRRRQGPGGYGGPGFGRLSPRPPRGGFPGGATGLYAAPLRSGAAPLRSAALPAPIPGAARLCIRRHKNTHARLVPATTHGSSLATAICELPIYTCLKPRINQAKCRARSINYCELPGKYTKPKPSQSQHSGCGYTRVLVDLLGIICCWRQLLKT